MNGVLMVTDTVGFSRLVQKDSVTDSDQSDTRTKTLNFTQGI